MKQPSFFDQTQADLPLFSQTCDRTEQKPFVPKSRPGVQLSFEVFKCTACKDTGKFPFAKNGIIQYRNCWCSS